MATSSTTSQASVTSYVRPKLFQKKLWTPYEDAMLFKHIAVHGERRWKLISKKLAARSDHSCRMRWVYRLGPKMARLHKKVEPKPLSPSPPKFIDFLGMARLHKEAERKPPSPSPPKFIDFLGIGSNI